LALSNHQNEEIRRSSVMKVFDEAPMKIDWTTDNAGQMLGFGYHVARLTELEWKEERFFRMRLATTDGGTSIVELCDLHMITLQAVWNGMIVSDIFAWRVANVQETARRADWRSVIRRSSLAPHDQHCSPKSPLISSSPAHGNNPARTLRWNNIVVADDAYG
jgi:hypothetical protein